MAPYWQLALDRDTFLADYWQREPCLIAQAIPDFISPVSADELAGLALENEVESRLITCADGHWQLTHGPFAPNDFDKPGAWTLLVQSVDHYLDNVAALRRSIDFLPQWRVDDIMVSYATDGGGVGPHYDNYDVFLLQGEGQRLWKLGQRCDESSSLQANCELRVLDNFEQSAQYLLEPGDILYVPPGVAHWGIAKGESTTFSIGFRAPRMNDLVSRKVDQVLQHLSAESLYRDAGRARGRAGEITASDLDSAQQQITAAIAAVVGDEWFGELVTQVHDEALLAEDVTPLAQTLREGAVLLLAPDCRLAWQETQAGVIAYANGEALPVGPGALPVLIQLCGQWRLEARYLQSLRSNEDCVRLLEALYQRGCVYVGE